MSLEKLIQINMKNYHKHNIQVQKTKRKGSVWLFSGLIRSNTNLRGRYKFEIKYLRISLIQKNSLVLFYVKLNSLGA